MKSSILSRRSTVTGALGTGAARNDARSPSTVTPRPWAVVIVVAVLVGVVFGPLDLAGQVHTPYPFANLFNSPAVWAALAYAFGSWARNPRRAVSGAVVTIVVAVEMYYLADVLVRGADTGNLTSPPAAFWVLLGIGAGLVFGPAGALTHHRSMWVRTGARALLPAVFASEAVHQLIGWARTDADAGRNDSAQVALLLVVVVVGSLAWLVSVTTTSERTRLLLTTVVLTGAGTVALQLLTSVSV